MQHLFHYTKFFMGFTLFSVLWIFSIACYADSGKLTEFSLLKQRNLNLQCGLERVLKNREISDLARQGKVSLAITDISSIRNPQYAGINSTQMLYSASLPKIAILLGVLKKAEEGNLTWTQEVQDLAEAMIHHSANAEASELYYMVGPDYISNLLLSDKYKLYCPEQGGGLWIGKEYGKGDAWERDAECTFSHGANALQIVRYYYLLESGELLTASWTKKAKEILGATGLRHKFIAGLLTCCADAKVYRKSGSWGNFHADSVLVEFEDKKYIVAALIEDPDGDSILRSLIIDINSLLDIYKSTRFNCNPKFD